MDLSRTPLLLFETDDRIYTNYGEDPRTDKWAQYEGPRKKKQRPSFTPPAEWSPETDKSGPKPDPDKHEAHMRNLARRRKRWMRERRIKDTGQAEGPFYKERQAELQRRRDELARKDALDRGEDS